jgi:DHA1 family inner membrane transport protein
VRFAFASRVVAVLGLTVVVFASVYAVLTYIVPFLRGVTGVSGVWISVFLLAYGVATAVEGRFADRNAAGTLVGASVGVAGCWLVLAVGGAVPVLVAVVLLAVGGCVMGMAPSLQYRVVSLAGPGAGLAQSLPASAANVGIAVGSFAGGVALGRFSAAATVLTGLIIAVIAILVAWATSLLKPPVPEPASEQVAASTDALSR